MGTSFPNMLYHTLELSKVKMYPFFFSLYLNDLESSFEENNVEPLCNITNLCEESIQMYIKLFLILYANDTALMAESSDGLQKTSNCFEKYCDL